jgi:hypothetical protein
MSRRKPQYRKHAKTGRCDDEEEEEEEEEDNDDEKLYQMAHLSSRPMISSCGPALLPPMCCLAAQSTEFSTPSSTTNAIIDLVHTPLLHTLANKF